jgi:DhnA family fructose-bisphosphate aldolase class Ia
LVGVISGLGDSSRHTWLKLPYCEDFGRVTLATTMPILMLGGPSKEDPRPTYQSFSAGMATSANVRGALVGRNVSFPGREDPAAVAQAISDIVHRGVSANEAIEVTMANRDQRMDFLLQAIG